MSPIIIKKEEKIIEFCIHIIDSDNGEGLLIKGDYGEVRLCNKPAIQKVERSTILKGGNIYVSKYYYCSIHKISNYYLSSDYKISSI